MNYSGLYYLYQERTALQKTNTVSDIFKIAISLEKKAEAFYLGLSNKFSDHPEVSEFWKGMMKDEASACPDTSKIA